MELGSSGGALRACRYGVRELPRRAAGGADVEVWRSGSLEVRCRRADVEACCGPGPVEV